MFVFTDRRTATERKRYLEMADKRRAEDLLCLSALKNQIRPLLANAGMNVGLVSKSDYSGAQLLIEDGDVTYSLSLEVDHDS